MMSHEFAFWPALADVSLILYKCSDGQASFVTAQSVNMGRVIYNVDVKPFLNSVYILVYPSSFSFFFPADYFLRGEELPGSVLWVQHRLLRHPHAPEPLQFLQGGQWLLCGVRPPKLPGEPGLLKTGGLPWLSAHGKHDWHDGHGDDGQHPLLSHDPHGKILYLTVSLLGILFIKIKN